MEKETMPEDTMYGSMDVIYILLTVPFLIAVAVCIGLVCIT
jgi:hypothetical protein